MDELSGRLKREHETLVKMANIYCARHHDREPGELLCPECQDLIDYAYKRLIRCPFGEQKPTCANCPVHCYKRAQRDEVREVMRFSGPRMTFQHPVLAFLHLLDKRRRVEHPAVSRLKESRRQK